MGTSAKHRRRLPRADELLDDLDAEVPLELDDAPELDAEPTLGAAVLDTPRQARRRGKPARATKPTRAALSDDELDIADEWEPPARDRDRKRVEVSEPFKCRHCRAFVGIPPTGGRNRNHCPLCLYSLHVDGKTLGDRASDCHSLMAPIGTFYRPNLEQVVVHRCLGCGFQRYNRVAADDNPVVLSQLPVLDPADLLTTHGSES